MKQRKKRLRPWRMLMVAILMVTMFGISALAADAGEKWTENEFTVEKTDEVIGPNGECGGRIIAYTGTEKNVVIPEKVDGIRVTEVGEGAFRDCTTMETLTINHYVTLGRQAFEGCTALTDVYANSNYFVMPYWYGKDGFDDNGKCPFVGLHGVKMHNGPEVDQHNLYIMRAEHRRCRCQCDLWWYRTAENGQERLVPYRGLWYDSCSDIAVPLTMGENQLTLPQTVKSGNHVTGVTDIYQRGAFLFTPEEAGVYTLRAEGGVYRSASGNDNLDDLPYWDGNWNGSGCSTIIVALEAGEEFFAVLDGQTEQIDITIECLSSDDKITVPAEQADVSLDKAATSKILDSFQHQGDITTLAISKTQGGGESETLSLSLSDVSGQNLLPEETADANGTVTVSMPYEKQDDVVRVYYKKEDGMLEAVESTYDEAQGRVVFETKHFSDFLVTSEPAVADDPAPAPGPEPGATTEPAVADDPAPAPGPEPGATTEASFMDVQDPGQYYYDAVLWAVKNNITNGVGGGMFAPDNTCKREQVVTFLWRAMGSPEPTNIDCPFTDIAKGEYYYKAVLWAVENGITTGKTTEKFAPKDTVTRAEFVTFLWRAQGKPGHSTSNPFWDVPSGSYYYDAVLWAVENGITTGKTTEKFAPKDPCTRGHVVTFLYRDMA